ncbi:hypothetical protein LN139_22110 [Pseudomonas sp. KNUC1026]|nr:hypothetical protein [Pseudomonas sp. KNUC1026]UFH49483.1 hypothetical protein LN139_22110 [Pseudomonas sp. KNUC1026]
MLTNLPTLRSTPAAASAPAPEAAAPDAPAADGAASDTVPAQAQDSTLGMGNDLSPWGMYQHADVVVKTVMIGLAIASVITWTIWIAKGLELLGAKRRARREIAMLKQAASLKAAGDAASKKGTLAHLLVHDAMEEMHLLGNTREKKASRSA